MTFDVSYCCQMWLLQGFVFIFIPSSGDALSHCPVLRTADSAAEHTCEAARPRLLWEVKSSDSSVPLAGSCVSANTNLPCTHNCIPASSAAAAPLDCTCLHLGGTSGHQLYYSGSLVL